MPPKPQKGGKGGKAEEKAKKKVVEVRSSEIFKIEEIGWHFSARTCSSMAELEWQILRTENDFTTDRNNTTGPRSFPIIFRKIPI